MRVKIYSSFFFSSKVVLHIHGWMARKLQVCFKKVTECRNHNTLTMTCKKNPFLFVSKLCFVYLLLPRHLVQGCRKKSLTWKNNRSPTAKCSLALYFHLKYMQDLNQNRNYKVIHEVLNRLNAPSTRSVYESYTTVNKYPIRIRTSQRISQQSMRITKKADTVTSAYTKIYGYERPHVSGYTAYTEISTLESVYRNLRIHLAYTADTCGR